jgi:hypothetical protein
MEEGSAISPVGRVIQLLLKTSLNRFPKGTEILFDTIQLGFVSGSFFVRNADTPWWRRVEFFRRLREHLTAQVDGGFESFLLQFLTQSFHLFDPVEHESGNGLGALNQEEVLLYLSALSDFLVERPSLIRRFGPQIATVYFWSRTHTAPVSVREKWGGFLRRGGWSPAKVFKDFSEGKGWDNEE